MYRAGGAGSSLWTEASAKYNVMCDPWHIVCTSQSSQIKVSRTKLRIVYIEQCENTALNRDFFY